MLNSSIRAQYVLQCEDIISIMQLFLCLQRWQRSSVGVKPFRPFDHLPPSAHELHLLLFKHVCRNHTSVWERASEWERGWDLLRECGCLLLNGKERESVCVLVCATLCVDTCVRVCVCTSFDQGSELPSLHKETISNCFVIASVLNKSQLEAKMSNWFFSKKSKEKETTLLTNFLYFSWMQFEWNSIYSFFL